MIFSIVNLNRIFLNGYLQNNLSFFLKSCICLNYIGNTSYETNYSLWPYPDGSYYSCSAGQNVTLKSLSNPNYVVLEFHELKYRAFGNSNNKKFTGLSKYLYTSFSMVNTVHN